VLLEGILETLKSINTGASGAREEMAVVGRTAWRAGGS
jgi:hypothetical protein